MKKKLFIFSSLWLINSLAVTNLKLVDVCTTQPVYMTNPNGVALNVHIKDYDPDKDMEVFVDFYPSTKPEVQVKDTGLKKKYFYYRRETEGVRNVLGRKNLWFRTLIPSVVVMKNYERIHKTNPLWTVKVSWYQEGTAGQGSTAHLNFLRSDTAPVFYRPTARTLCYWESKAQVNSKIYQNDSNSPMIVNRYYADLLTQGSHSSFSLGNTPWSINTGSNTLIESPLASNGNLGWHFEHWDTSAEETDVSSLTRMWTLGPDEMAVFINRRSYARKPVEKWAWEADGRGCGEYRVVDYGVLDVEYTTEDFVIIPEDFYNIEEMQDYIDAHRPVLNTCTASSPTNQSQPNDVIINSHNKLYFYSR